MRVRYACVGGVRCAARLGSDGAQVQITMRYHIYEETPESGSPLWGVRLQPGGSIARWLLVALHSIERQAQCAAVAAAGDRQGT
jgi:hypothetical protein